MRVFLMMFFFAVWLIALGFWLYFAFNLMILEMWVAHLFMWVGLIGKVFAEPQKVKTVA